MRTEDLAEACGLWSPM